MCIAEQSAVATSTGLKNIEDVTVEDLVLTEDGTYQRCLGNFYKGEK